MSWGFTFAGEPKAVAAQVEKSSAPQGIKDCVAKLAEGVVGDKILVVESNGHLDAQADPQYNYGGSGTLSFKVNKKAEQL